MNGIEYDSSKLFQQYLKEKGLSGTLMGALAEVAWPLTAVATAVDAECTTLDRNNQLHQQRAKN